MKHALSLALALAFPLAMHAQPLGPEQKRLHAIYKELIETNTTHSAGDTTLAAQRMAKHLRDAGFADAECWSSSRSRRKAISSSRLKGDGSKRPLLLLAHLDVVEALRADWQTDPFVLQETNGYFTARGPATTRRWRRRSSRSSPSCGARASGRSATSFSRSPRTKSAATCRATACTGSPTTAAS
jgi:hypothetical protein